MIAIPTPNTLYTKILKNEEILIDEIRTQIVEKMYESYDKDTVYTISVKQLSPRVVNYLKDEFKKQGWLLTYQAILAYRNEDSYIITIKENTTDGNDSYEDRR